MIISFTLLFPFLPPSFLQLPRKMDDNDSRKAISGPVRKPHGGESKKPYARPTRDAIQREDSQASLLGGLKSVFRSFFSASPAPQGEGEGDADRTRSDPGSGGDSSSDDEEEEKGGSKRVLPSPDGESRHSKRIRRTSLSPPHRLATSHSLGYGNSLNTIASGSGMKRSGTLLSLDTRKSRPNSTTTADARTRKPLPEHWSPWNEQSEAVARRQTNTTTGFSRSGSVGYGLHAPHASPWRHSHASPRAGLFVSQQAPRPRSVLHPIASASLVRSPSLPGMRGMREQRRETTALPSSPVPRSGLRHEVDLERSPSVQRIRDSSVLSGMSGLVVREPRWGKEPSQSIGTSSYTPLRRAL